MTTVRKHAQIYIKDERDKFSENWRVEVNMKRRYAVFLISVFALAVLCGCSGIEYGSYYYFPTYPYEYSDPYNDYYLYNYYYYSYPYVYRFPPRPYYFDEKNREFRSEESEEREIPPPEKGREK